jgi:hypothetical protein
MCLFCVRLNLAEVDGSARTEEASVANATTARVIFIGPSSYYSNGFCAAMSGDLGQAR